MRQYAGFSSAEETNRRFRYLLDQGQTGLSVAFDLPTQIGFDPDHPMAEGEVGKVGVSIASLRDLERLFEAIPLDRVSTSMTINSTASILLAMYESIARAQGVPSEKIRGTIQNDILKEYVARGTYRFPVEASLRLITDVFAHCSGHLPAFHPISISGYHMREAGCTAVQEIAFTFAHALAYVEAALEAGLEVDRFAPRLSFFFNVHSDFLEEIAKFRAARRIWALLMRDRYGARDPRSLALRFHAQTAGSTLTSQQPRCNVVRVAYQALAAVLGGTQSLHTNSWDEALSLPGEESVRLALRTQQILAHETGVARTIDPLGGAPLVEELTDEVERRAMELLDRIDAMGGAVAAVKAGFVQKEIHRSAYRVQREIEAGRKKIVGVNVHRMEEPEPEIFRVDPAVREARIEDLRTLREDRDGARVEKALERLEDAAAGRDPLMPRIRESVDAYATIGEICASLEKVFGSHEEVRVL
jgi:methylmalonyl-CoA mutase N-terminal domain/subunit